MSRSQWFEYHDRESSPLCPKLLSLLDEHARTTGAKIALSLDAGNPYRYYKFRDEADFAATSGGCPPENGACALGDAVYSTRSFHAHELAHDYAFRAWGGWSVGLLDEGVAVALSCEPFEPFEPTQRPFDALGSPDWRDVLNVYGDTSAGYAAAGFFVTYLAERYGWPSVARLHHRVPQGISQEDFEREFAAVYPISVDQAWAEALSAAGAHPCQRDWRCMATPMMEGDEAAPDCDGEMHRSVVVSHQDGVVLSLDGEDVEMTLVDCADAAPSSYAVEGAHGAARAVHWASLPPGSYAMFPGPLPAHVTLKAYLPRNLVADTCESATPVALDPDGETYIDLLAGAASGWIRVAGGGRAYEVSTRDLIWNDLTATDAVALCNDCGTAPTCVPIPYGQSTAVTIGDHAVLQLRGVFVAPPPSALWGHVALLPLPRGASGR